MTEDEMVGWHHQLNGHEYEQTLGDGEGQGSQACCSPWGHKESDTTQQLNNNNDLSCLWEQSGPVSHTLWLTPPGSQLNLDLGYQPLTLTG